MIKASNNQSLVQALMIQLLSEARIAYSNIYQRWWGHGDCCEWPDGIDSAQIGEFTIRFETHESDSWITFSFGGLSVTTEYGGKRLFHYGVSDPLLSDMAWVDWFNRASRAIADENRRVISRELGIASRS